MLSTFFEAQATFKEIPEEDKTILAFKNPEIETAFKERRQNLIEAYAKLLAFEELFKRVEKEYETDLASHAKERRELIRGFLEHLNEAIGTATGTSDKLTRKNHRIFKRQEIVELEDDLVIDIDAIVPDKTATKEHEEELRRILGEF